MIYLLWIKYPYNRLVMKELRFVRGKLIHLSSIYTIITGLFESNVTFIYFDISQVNEAKSK